MTQTVSDLGCDMGTVTITFPENGIQNGSPDGIALVDGSSTVVQFLSYEGSFTAADGAANGMLSVDIGVAQYPAPAVGISLQLTGTGCEYADFTWSSGLDTFGDLNISQEFSGS